MSDNIPTITVKPPGTRLTRLPETVVTAKRLPPEETPPARVDPPPTQAPETPSTPNIVRVAPEAFAGVACVVEIYPFEGGKLSLQGHHILSCSVSKTRDSSGGRFSISLAPGGPLGVEGSPTWSQVITPMSLVLIGMQRGDVAEIVLVGVVRSVGEQQVWTTTDSSRGSSAQRGQAIQGEDFSYYFLAQNYAAMTLFGVTSGTTFGNAVGIPPELGFPANVSQGMIGGTQSTPSNPSKVASEWYKLMMGPLGMMSSSFVPYQPAGARLKIFQIVKQIWEDYPASIPLAASFLGSEGSWMAKFQEILPWPWYEFFITTAPIGAYEETLQKAQSAPGKPFTMEAMPLARPVCPMVVGRVNPIPVLNTTATTMGGKITLGTIDVKRWSKLIIYDMTDYGFTASYVGFSIGDARNVYILNPTSMTPFFGNSATTAPAAYQFAMLGDPASIHRYGYRPEIRTTWWWFDQLGMFSGDSAKGMAQGVSFCLAMLAGQYHPTPFMGRGSVTIPLQPDILPGNIFRYAPFKSAKPGNATWDFYIDTVQHEYVFGAGSRTTLTLSRGLPTAIYTDTTSGGVFEAIWKGDARREDGDYLAGLPKDTGPGLIPIESTTESISAFLGKIGQAYVTPGL